MGNGAPIKSYAFLDGFLHKLKRLSMIAEKENWRYDAPGAITDEQKEYAVLFSYVYHTFERAQDENKLLESQNNAIMNTGLLSPTGEEIFALFDINKFFGVMENAQKWHLDGFYVESAHKIPVEFRNSLPEHVDYFKDCPEDIYFNPSYKLFLNMSHIVEDNYDRVPQDIQSFGKSVVIQIFENSGQYLQKRISRNNRLVVPQYYNKKIMYLAPLCVGEHVVALAIERNEQSYRVNTIFTPGMAYCNARLVMKPESKWLTNDI